MDRLQLMTVFVAVAEEQSFAAGARRLSLSPPAVTRAVATLEAQLGVKLFTRTTRYVRVTDARSQALMHNRVVIWQSLHRYYLVNCSSFPLSLTICNAIQK